MIDENTGTNTSHSWSSSDGTDYLSYTVNYDCNSTGFISHLSNILYYPNHSTTIIGTAYENKCAELESRARSRKIVLLL
jgi:hypothetical protein